MPAHRVGKDRIGRSTPEIGPPGGFDPFRRRPGSAIKHPRSGFGNARDLLIIAQALQLLPEVFLSKPSSLLDESSRFLIADLQQATKGVFPVVEIIAKLNRTIDDI